MTFLLDPDHHARHAWICPINFVQREHHDDNGIPAYLPFTIWLSLIYGTVTGLSFKQFSQMRYHFKAETLSFPTTVTFVKYRSMELNVQTFKRRHIWLLEILKSVTSDLWPKHIHSSVSLFKWNRLQWMTYRWKGKQFGFLMIWNMINKFKHIFRNYPTNKNFILAVSCERQKISNMHKTK